MKEDSYSPQQKILNFAVVNKEQLNTELSKGLNKEFRSFTSQKLNINGT